MTATTRHIGLYLGLIASVAGVLSAPAGAVLCLADDHVAVEPEHDGCCLHTSAEPGIRLKSADSLAQHHCCIDIPLPSQNRPCTLDINAGSGDLQGLDVPCPLSGDLIAAPTPVPPFNAFSCKSNTPTATIVLLI